MLSKYMTLGTGKKQEGVKQQEGRRKKKEPVERKGR